jgi:hypothetical protein
MGFRRIFTFLKSKSKLHSQDEKLPFSSDESQDNPTKQKTIEHKEASNTSFSNLGVLNTSSWTVLQLPTTLPTLQPPPPQSPPNSRRRRVPEGKMHQLNVQYAELVIKLQLIPQRKRKYSPLPASLSSATITRRQSASLISKTSIACSITTGTITADVKKESALDRLVKRRSEQTTEHMQSSIMSLSEARRSSLQVICEDALSEMTLSAASLTNSDGGGGGGGKRSSRRAGSDFVEGRSGSKNRLKYWGNPKRYSESFIGL